jgi:ATP-binding cassette subfamily C protein CydC
MSGLPQLHAILARQRRAQRISLATAAGCAVVAVASAVLLLSLSGWFITGAALAGLAGTGAAQAFNVLLPSAAIRLLAILRTGARYMERVSGHDAALKALASLRPALFAELASAAPAKALAISSGEASARFVQDVDAIQTLFVRLSGPWGAVAGFIAAIGLAGLADVRAGIVVAIGLAISTVGSLVIGRQGIDPAGRAVQIAVGQLKDRVSSLQASAAELRAYGIENWAVVETDHAASALDQATRQASVAGSWVAAWQTLVMGATAVGVFAVSIQHSPALVALALLAAVASLEAASSLTVHFRSAGAADQALSRLSELIPPPAAPAPDVLRMGPVSRLAFRSVALSVEPSRRLVIAGATGLGKTTLIERLMGLRPSSDRSLTVAGVASCDQDPAVLRRQFSYAAQEVRLLAGTVRTNLRIADPDASDHDLWGALEDAALADRVRLSRLGLDMPLGENGACLSGGERRRLGLARAYLRSAPWLVLDEPTEGLDALCEARVIEGLRRRLDRSGQGLIVISHRPALRSLCDTAIEVLGLQAGGEHRLVISERRAVAA